ncbi:MAG TPA: chromate efflux transporter [Rhabdaerophilum sp.]|nr:chromate efflux transporter [Rhabdaerophilum sp.]
MIEASSKMTDDAPPARPSFGEALPVWLKIGLTSFGGPAGQIALMHRILVEEKRWIAEPHFLHALNYCMLLPGPEAQQLATYIGWRLHGLRGGLVAGILFVLPGFCVILGLSVLYALYRNTGWLGALFFGLKAAVLAVVIEALVRVARRALKTRAHLAVAGAAFFALFAFSLPFPLVIAAAALIGWQVPIFQPAIAREETEETAPIRSRGWAGTLTTLAAGLALWVLPLVPLVALFGTHSVFVPIAAFFSKMAVVTFGGAYAVLSYVAQEAVETFRWLRPGEMLDGLALAETTPGPLILVLVYVGFLAAFRDPGPLSPLVSGVIGASLTTWVTFVPCFLWIFLGAPYVERLQRNRALSGALSAVTAAVVGVILNLAIWFGLHVLFREVGKVRLGPLEFAWPHPASLDLTAGGLAALAMVALFRLKLGMVPTLALCGALGYALRLVLP